MGWRRISLALDCPVAIAPRSKRPASWRICVVGGEDRDAAPTCVSSRPQFLAECGRHRHWRMASATSLGPPPGTLGTREGVGLLQLGSQGQPLRDRAACHHARYQLGQGAQGGSGGHWAHGPRLLLPQRTARSLRQPSASGRHSVDSGWRSQLAGLQPPSALSTRRALLAPQAARPSPASSWRRRPPKKDSKRCSLQARASNRRFRPRRPAVPISGNCGGDVSTGWCESPLQ